MKRQLTIKLISGLINLIASLVSVAIILYRQDWFGKGDVEALIFWTIPLGVGLAVSGNTLININILKTDKVILRVPYILIVAALIAYGWIYFVFLILGPWINTFSFPIFFLWTIGNFSQLLFLDRLLHEQESKQNLIIGLMTFPLTLIGSVVLIYALSTLKSYLTRPKPQTYLIHENFEGRFRVIYGEECGLEPRVENGRRILEVPNNGILIIKPEFKAGIIDHEYYLVDNKGGKFKMNELWTYDQKRTKAPGVLLGGSGSMGAAMPDGSETTESPFAIHFTDFTVFNADTTTLDQRTQFKFDQKFDSLTTALVEDCRVKNGR